MLDKYTPYTHVHILFWPALVLCDVYATDAPQTLLMHWHKELEICGLGRCIHAFYGDSASERAASLAAATGESLCAYVCLCICAYVCSCICPYAFSPYCVQGWQRCASLHTGAGVSVCVCVCVRLACACVHVRLACASCVCLSVVHVRLTLLLCVAYAYVCACACAKRRAAYLTFPGGRQGLVGVCC